MNFLKNEVQIYFKNIFANFTFKENFITIISRGFTLIFAEKDSSTYLFFNP